MDGEKNQLEPTEDGTAKKKQVCPLLDPYLPTSTKVYMLAKTVCLVLVWIAMGMFSSAFSTTMPDMLPRIEANYETFSRAASFGALGMIAGSSLGMICDKLPKWTDLIMAGFLALTSLCIITLPWTRSLVLFGIMYAMCAAAGGTVNAVGNYIMTSLWKAHAALPLHVMHFGFGVGAFISPLFVAPYLSPDILDTANNNTNGTVTMTPIATTESISNVSSNSFNSRIEVPYVIISGAWMLTSISFVIFQFIGQPKGLQLYERGSDSTKRSPLHHLSPRSIAEGNLAFGTIIILGISLYYLALSGSDGTVRFYLFSFAIEGKHKFLKQEAALLESMFNLSYTIGRVMGGIIALLLPIQIILFVQLFGAIVAMGCLTFFLQTKLHLWIFACLFGFMAGPNWPAGFSWANRYVLCTATFFAWVGTVPSLLTFGLGWFTGYLFEQVSPDALIFYGFCMTCLAFVVMIVLQIIASKHGERFKRTLNTEKTAIPDEGFRTDNSEDTRL